jgi:hypothetical protein
MDLQTISNKLDILFAFIVLLHQSDSDDEAAIKETIDRFKAVESADRVDSFMQSLEAMAQAQGLLS